MANPNYIHLVAAASTDKNVAAIAKVARDVQDADTKDNLDSLKKISDIPEKAKLDKLTPEQKAKILYTMFPKEAGDVSGPTGDNLRAFKKELRSNLDNPASLDENFKSRVNNSMESAVKQANYVPPPPPAPLTAQATAEIYVDKKYTGALDNYIAKEAIAYATVQGLNNPNQLTKVADKTVAAMHAAIDKSPEGSGLKKLGAAQTKKDVLLTIGHEQENGWYGEIQNTLQDSMDKATKDQQGKGAGVDPTSVIKTGTKANSKEVPALH